jgi:DNA topoisomerase-1
MANNMPKINRKINKDINKKNTKNGISKDKLIALIIKIIMKCNFRVGKDLYKVKYNSTGITTITRRNIKMYPSHVTISFNGKKGVFNQCSIKDRQILNILKRLYKAKNKDIFTYVESESDSESDSISDSNSNKSITIDERDVNEYLKQFDENITSKNFRTYNANMLYLNKIQKYQQPSTITARKKLSNEVVKDVATHLHHTPAICKKSYLNRDIVDSYINYPQVFNKYFISNKNSNSIQFIKFLKNNK